MRKTIIALVCFLAMATVALAHHSYNAFMMDSTINITGVVKKFDWSNPHSWIWVDVKDEKGVTDTWGIEGMSPNYLSRRGWSRTTLKPGDQITLTIHPLRDNQHGGSFVSAKRPNGETLSQTGAIVEP